MFSIGPLENAGQAALELLNTLRRALGNTWCLVPPLRLGLFQQQEGVLVFFDAAVLQFQGPNLFFNRYYLDADDEAPVGQGQPVADVTFAFRMDYPPEWKDCLPWPYNEIDDLRLDRQTVFPGNPENFIVNECQLAWQGEYYLPNTYRPIPSPIQPPSPTNRIQFPAANCRAPFWTQFRELVPGGTHTEPLRRPYIANECPGASGNKPAASGRDGRSSSRIKHGECHLR
jgi:hypothetical protein